MQLQISILPISDDAALSAFEKVVPLVPGVTNPMVRGYFGNAGGAQHPLQNFRAQAAMAAVLAEHAEVFSSMEVSFQTTASQPPQGCNLALRRVPNGETTVTMNLTDAWNSQDDILAPMSIAFRKAFHEYSRSNVIRDISPIIDDYYQRMEATTVRLIELNGDIIRQNDEHRRKLEVSADEQKSRLQADYLARSEALQAEYAAKVGEIKLREDGLEERKKALDDRDNTHARRQKQEDLNAKLQQYQAAFRLTKDTERKRLPVTWGFVVGLVVIGSLVAVNTWAALLPLISGIPFWWQPLRVVGYTLAFAGLLIYFIRWQDRWAQTHADEEFQLKHLELDGLRAGWLVEVLLEWQRETKGDVPTELIQKLGTGLFEHSTARPGATHPVEDTIASVLGSSSSLRLDFPGGKATLDRKALERARSAGG